jgi:Trypsin-co-occurring domain 1
MKELVEYRVLDDSGKMQTIIVEVENPAIGKTVPVSKGQVVQATDTLQDALKKVQPALNAISKTLREINQPKEMEIELGLKLTAKAGVVIASVDSEVTFKVTLKWQN